MHTIIQFYTTAKFLVWMWIIAYIEHWTTNKLQWKKGETVTFFHSIADDIVAFIVSTISNSIWHGKNMFFLFWGRLLKKLICSNLSKMTIPGVSMKKQNHIPLQRKFSACCEQKVFQIVRLTIFLI